MFSKFATRPEGKLSCIVDRYITQSGKTIDIIIREDCPTFGATIRRRRNEDKRLNVGVKAIMVDGEAQVLGKSPLVPCVFFSESKTQKFNL